MLRNKQLEKSLFFKNSEVGWSGFSKREEGINSKWNITENKFNVRLNNPIYKTIKY